MPPGKRPDFAAASPEKWPQPQRVSNFPIERGWLFVTVSVMIDIVIAAVIVAFGALGWKRGLLRTLSELAVVVVCLFLASQISTLAARFIVDDILRPATEKAVEQQVTVIAGETARTVREKVGDVLEGIPNAFVRKHAQALLEDTAIQEHASAAGREALLKTSMQLTDRVLNTVVYNLVHSLLYAVCFGTLNFALRSAFKVLRRVFRLPGLKQLNEAGGMLLGVGKGVILAYLGVWILSRAGVLTEEMTSGSILLGLAGCLPGKLRL